MNKAINKTIIYGLGILAVLALGVIPIPTVVSAETYGTNYDYGTFGNPNATPTNIFSPLTQTQTFVNTQPALTPTVYSSSTNPNITIPTPPRTPSTPASPTPAVEANDEDDNDLAAGVIFGADSFIPSGILEWILLAILILLLAILIRKVFGMGEKYYATPMKHD